MSPRIEQIGDCTLYLGDCREVVPALESVNLVVTSPPYAEQRQYGLVQFNWRQTVCGSLAKFNGDPQILVNLGLVHRNGEVVRYWDALLGEMADNGWKLFGWYVWDKGFGAPGDWQGRLAPAHEFIFHFNKTAKQPAKRVQTLGYKHVGKGLRRADGSMSGISSPELIGQALKIPDSVLRITPQQSRVGIEKGHPAVFPVEFPAHLVSSYSDANDMVVDPFMGSGTTGVACVKLGRRFTGIEIHEPYFDIACRRIADAVSRPDLFITATPEPPVEQISLLDEAAA